MIQPEAPLCQVRALQPSSCKGPDPGPSQASNRMFHSSVLLALALLAGPSSAQLTDSEVPRDQARGRWMNFEVGILEPFEFSSDGETLFVLNQPGNRLVFMDRQSRTVLREVPLGLGLCSVRRRPGTSELWTVDTVMSTVSIVDADTGEIRRSLRVGAEPHGLVFDAAAQRAYVSCAGARQVDVVDASSFEVVRSIALTGREPRGIARVGQRVFVTPLLSGNGTAPRGADASLRGSLDIRTVEAAEGEGLAMLPDRDLHVIELGETAEEDILLEESVRGLGTNLFSIAHRPGTSELWIPHTESLNGAHKGEKNFPGGQVVQNRVSVVDAESLELLRIIDLDALAPTPEEACNAPTDVEFTPDGSRAFVSGYGSDSVAVLDLDAEGQPTWRGIVRINLESGYPDGAGPRVSRLDPQLEYLWILNKGDLSLTRVALEDLPLWTPDFEFLPASARELGWDPTPSDINQGRVHFIRTRNSLSMTSSCNSCHIDGYHDGLAWDLSAFADAEGTEDPHFGVDHKGPMVTSSVRHLREVGPYHWRGERKDLFDFNSTFTTLLERTNEAGELEDLKDDFRYITQYMEHLALLPNPQQALDREYTAEQLEGARLFMEKPVVDGLSCADCHQLPLGTSGEITSTRDGGLAPTGVVPQLRQVSSKLTPVHEIGGAFGLRNELGAGLNHGGEAPSLEAVMLEPLPDGSTRFDLTPEEAASIAAFLEVLDTGLAPAAAYQATAHAGNLQDFEAEQVPFLREQAERGNCEVVFRYGPELVDGVELYRTGLLDSQTGQFLQPSGSAASLSFEDLMVVAASRPVTFMGVPVLMGQPMGIDRDNDKVLDLDELLSGTDPENDDSDGDSFPDGYELLWGTDPLSPNGPGAISDTSPPSLLGPVRQVYVTTNSVKLEFETNEATRVIFFVDGQPVLRAPLFPKHDTEFSEILSMLEPGTTYEIELWLRDPRGNLRIDSTTVTTRSLVQGQPVHVEAIDLEVLAGVDGSWLRAGVRLAAQGSPDLGRGWNLRGRVFHRAPDGVLSPVTEEAQGWTYPSSSARIFVRLPESLVGKAGELIFVIEDAAGPPGSPPYVEANDQQSLAILPL